MKTLFFAILVLCGMGVCLADVEAQAWKPRPAWPDQMGIDKASGKKKFAIDVLLDDSAAIGFFSIGFPGSSYTILYKEDDAYAICFINFESHSVWQPIDKALGEQLEAILAKEIANATARTNLGMGGTTYRFGIKQNGQWQYAEVWTPRGPFMQTIGMISHAAARSYETMEARLACVRDAVEQLQSMYRDDKRPSVDREEEKRQRAKYERYVAQHANEEGIMPDVRLETVLECASDGDLRVRIIAKGLPENSDFLILLEERWAQIYAVVHYRDTEGNLRVERIFKVVNSLQETKAKPLDTHTMSLGEISPHLREMILQVCPEPARIEAVEVALSWGYFSSKAFSKQYHGHPIFVPLQTLPIVALRENLAVRSVPLSQRDLSAVLARDADGRITQFKDRLGHLFACEYGSALPVEKDLPDFSKISTFEKHNYDLNKVIGLKKLYKNGELVREEGDLGNGVFYTRAFGDYGSSNTYFLYDTVRGVHLRLWDNNMEYELWDDAQIPYGARQKKSAEASGAVTWPPQDLLPWLDAFAALDVRAEVVDAAGEPALYLVVTQTSDSPVSLSPQMVATLSIHCEVPMERGLMIKSSSNRVDLEAPVRKGNEWWIAAKAPWSATASDLLRRQQAGHLPPLEIIKKLSLSFEVKHLSTDAQGAAIQYNTAHVSADAPALRRALGDALKAAQAQAAKSSADAVVSAP